MGYIQINPNERTTMTVRDLIARLSQLDPSLTVEITDGEWYQGPLTDNEIFIQDRDGSQYVVIGAVSDDE